MKKFLAILFLTIAFNSQAQIVAPKSQRTVVGSAKMFGAFVAELSFDVVGTDTTYSFTYNNAKSESQDLKTIKFKASQSELNQLYEMMKAAFDKRNKDYKVDLTLGCEPISIRTQNDMGVLRVAVEAKDGMVFIRKNELDKLFGK